MESLREEARLRKKMRVDPYKQRMKVMNLLRKNGSFPSCKHLSQNQDQAEQDDQAEV